MSAPYTKLCGVAFAAVGLLAPSVAVAFPNKPIRIVVPYSAGGNADLLARALGQRMADALGQSAVVDNRAGGASITGTDIVARSSPDGHTLLLTGTAHTTNSTLFKKLPYDSLKDFSGVTLIATAPLLLLVNPSLPAKSTSELIALAKAKPGQITLASAGIGGGSHLAGELFEFSAGVDLIHVPYKGSAPALTDLMGGQVSVMFETIIAGLPHVRSSSKLRALAVTSAKRSPLLPDIPTVAEGGVSGYESNSWYGVLTPSQTPRSVVSLLNSVITRILKQPDMVERLLAQGAVLVANSPAEYDDFLRRETAKWAKVIQAAGIRAE